MMTATGSRQAGSLASLATASVSQPVSRRHFTRQRRSLSANQRQHAARLASLHLPKLAQRLRHNNTPDNTPVRVAVYLPDFGELPTQPIVDWCVRLGYQVYLPIIRSAQTSGSSTQHRTKHQKQHRTQHRRMSFAPIHQHKLLTLPSLPHALGMQQIHSRHLLPAAALDVVFCPLVAVDRQGNRMGMGGGFYDATLADARSLVKVGWCYDFQLVEYLPAQPWDVAMDWVLSPSGCLQVSPQS